MKKSVLVVSSTLVLFGGLSVSIALGATSSSASGRPIGPTVKVTVKTLTRTLLRPIAARGQTGWITKGGTPRGKCSAGSAAGALNAATHGRWAGRYYSDIGGIFIQSILGVKPPVKSYWSIYVNGRSASQGICGLKLRAGEQLLFKIHK